MPLLSLDHVQLAMPPGGEPEARRFYAGVLGLKEVAKPAVLAGRGGCWFERGGLKLHLGVEADFRPAKKAHPALVVSRLADLLATAREGGFKAQGPEPFLHWRQAYLFDPFGNRLELLEETEASIPS